MFLIRLSTGQIGFLLCGKDPVSNSQVNTLTWFFISQIFTINAFLWIVRLQSSKNHSGPWVRKKWRRWNYVTTTHKSTVRLSFSHNSPRKNSIPNSSHKLYTLFIIMIIINWSNITWLCCFWNSLSIVEDLISKGVGVVLITLNWF